VRFLGLSPQVTDRGLLLLEGLAQVLVRDAEMDQLPVEPRDIVVPLLKGCLRPLERGALLLEPTLRLFRARCSRSRAARGSTRAAWASTRATRSYWS
jgi:hypothetical protein